MATDAQRQIEAALHTVTRELDEERALTRDLRGSVRELHDALLGARKHVYIRWLFSEHVGTPDSEPPARLVLDSIDDALASAEALLS